MRSQHQIQCIQPVVLKKKNNLPTIYQLVQIPNRRTSVRSQIKAMRNNFVHINSKRNLQPKQRQQQQQNRLLKQQNRILKQQNLKLKQQNRKSQKQRNKQVDIILFLY